MPLSSSTPGQCYKSPDPFRNPPPESFSRIAYDTALLQLALGLAPPWTVSRSDFDPEARRLDIEIDFTPGSRFACPACGTANCPVHDTERRTWRHLDFVRHQAYLNARVRRIHCDKCGVRTVSVPWARPDSGFSLLFKAMAATTMAAMPVKTVARMVGEHDTRLWRVLHHYVDAGRTNMTAAGVTRIALDETAIGRGQDDFSLFVDLAQRRVLFATEGKDAATVAAFADDLAAHGGDLAAVAEVCIDMSPAFIKAVTENLPEASITFDKFHAVKIVNAAVEKVRREEQKSRPELNASRWAWLKNESNLSSGQRELRDSLTKSHLKTARAYQIRLTFHDLYDQPSAGAAAGHLKRWYFWATGPPTVGSHR